MREPRDRAYYAIEGEDGHPRVCHSLVQPDGSIEITEAQAKGISAAVRSRDVRETKAEKVAGLSRDDVERMLADSEKRAVGRALAAIAKATGESNADQR